MASQSNLERELQASGDRAREYAQVLGLMPQTFVLAVRNLMIDMREGLLQPSPRSTFQIRRLLKAPTVLSSIYFATQTFMPKSLSKERPVTPLAMSHLYDPVSLGSLLALAYLFRRCRRICDAEEWKFISEPLQRNLEMGGLIGGREKEIGMGYGILTGSMLFVAFSTLLAKDKKGFTEYRRYLKKHARDIDPKYERAQWGCTSAQIAGNVLLSMGFGVNLAAGLAAAFLIDLKSAPPKDGFVRRFFAARSCISSVYNSGKLPPFIRGTKSDYHDLMDQLAELVDEGSTLKWLERAKDEIGDGKSPELVIVEGESAPPTKASVPQASELVYIELPYDIKAALSEAEFHTYRYNTLEEIRVILGLTLPDGDSLALQ